MSCLVTVSPLGFGLSLCLESLAALETSSVSQVQKLSASFAAFTFTQVPFGLSPIYTLNCAPGDSSCGYFTVSGFFCRVEGSPQTSAASWKRDILHRLRQIAYPVIRHHIPLYSSNSRAA